ncbi:hypothetical protein C4K30_0350 [Pseudomonas chlororaphis subsp. piscium]|nr:hypothetical protein C4K30_0350 [Pseudomonas chlororaphis subsp. piscium]
MNIFAQEKSCIALTIDETVAVVMKLAEEQSGEIVKQVKLK